MRVALVLGVVGHLVVWFAPAAAPCLAIAIADGHVDETWAFAGGMAATALAGWLLARLRDPAQRLHRPEVMAVVALVWLLVGVLSGIPLLLSGMGPLDAAFEALSGITTTGASVITDFGAYGRAVYLWRAILHWIGGLGVIALFVVILPQLGIAGRQLFFAEASSAPADGVAPQVRRLSGRLWAVYAILTALEVGMLLAFGMPWFDAVCNALATLSAGGFSPNASSIAGYGLPACEWVVAVFMFLAGANFALQWRTLAGRPLSLSRDPEFRVYAAAAVVGAAVVATSLAGGIPGEHHWRDACFQVASVISATGFASTDFNLWADGARGMLVALMLFGGCAGSAAGGPKVVRYMIVGKHCRREMVRTLHPQAVGQVRVGRTIVSDEVLRAVVVFVVLYLVWWGAASLLLALMGLDLVSALTGTLACLANCGPGLNQLGPMANYEHLPAAAKVLLMLTMWVGRLEVVTVLALARPAVLRQVRWR